MVVAAVMLFDKCVQQYLEKRISNLEKINADVIAARQLLCSCIRTRTVACISHITIIPLHKHVVAEQCSVALQGKQFRMNACGWNTYPTERPLISNPVDAAKMLLSSCLVDCIKSNTPHQTITPTLPHFPSQHHNITPAHHHHIISALHHTTPLHHTTSTLAVV